MDVEICCETEVATENLHEDIVQKMMRAIGRMTTMEKAMTKGRNWD